MRHGIDRDSWARAAKKADFAFYELDTPKPSARWSGGWGSSGGSPTSLEILFLVAGREVSCEAQAPERRRHAQPRDVEVRDLASMTLWDSLHSHEAELDLPHTWTVEAADRNIAVDGEPVTFTGVVLDGRWAGSATLNSGVHVTIKAPIAVAPDSIVRCQDWSMSELPPDASH